MGRGPLWNEAENAIIREEYARAIVGWPARAHTRLPHRTLGAIRQHAIEEGLTAWEGNPQRRWRSRRGKRKSRAEHARYYGNAPTTAVKVVLPEPLAAWLDEFARQRDITRSTLYEEIIDLWVATTQDWRDEEYGTTMPPPPGQYPLDSPWHPDNMRADDSAPDAEDVAHTDPR